MTKPRILVVEDEGIVAEDIQRSLQSLGYVVSAVVSSGENAVQKAEENMPDLVLMDIVLKGEMNGISAADQIHSRFNIPVIYITAYTDKKTLERAKLTEPFGYIVKPFEERELQTAVEIALYKSKMEKKLRESKEWLSTILKSIGDAVIVTDKQGCVKFMNSVAESLTGWKEEEAAGSYLRNVLNIVNEETRQQVEDPAAKVIKEGIVVGLANHTLLIARDGTEIPIDDSGAPIRDARGNINGVVVVFHDIIERRKSEKALKESEKRYRALYENALAGIYRSRISDGKIIMANQVAADILGCDSIEELTGEFVFGESYSSERREELLKRLEKYGAVSDFEIRVTRKDGKKADLVITAKIYPEEDYIEGAMIDVTDKKRLEAQLQQAQKMESIGTLAGGIAHDFNNLLMGIQGYISLMLNDLDPSHSHYKRLKGIEEQVKSGAELAAQLLGFARAGKYDVKPTDINEVLGKSAQMFGRTKKEIAIREKYAQDLWTVEVDRGQIEQVILNIFVNAWQAMPRGGDLYVETSNTVLDESHAGPYRVRPGRYVRISITDTGTGMDEETKKRIFDPFFTTKEIGRGTGLGLASAYGIIKNHDGMIDIYSEKGRGSTFNIYLPAVEATVTAKQPLPGDEEMRHGKETILLVDDQQIVLDVGKEMLRRLGYNVFPASGGDEAIEVYKANKDKIDLVILDIIMPGMDGGETYDVLKRINPDITVILSSGYNINGRAMEIMRQGANDFIQKPFTMKELSYKIREVLDGKKLESLQSSAG